MPQTIELFALFILSLLALGLTFAYLSIFLSVFSLAPWVPSRSRDLKRAIGLSDLKAGEVFADLGCGDGRAVFAAHKFFGAKARGIELAWPLYLFCRAKKYLFYNRADIVFKYGDLFREDLSDIDVIFVYDLPGSLEKRLKSKLGTELKPGARVISYGFAIKGLEPSKISRPDKKHGSVFVYNF